NSTYIYSTTGWPEPNFELLSDSTDIQQAILQLREIKVSGLKGISDSMISIYNEYGIKSKLTFTNEVLVGEVSIPLDLVELNSTNGMFTHQIRLNGVPIPPRPEGIPRPPIPYVVVGTGLPPPGYKRNILD